MNATTSGKWVTLAMAAVAAFALGCFGAGCGQKTPASAPGVGAQASAALEKAEAALAADDVAGARRTLSDALAALDKPENAKHVIPLRNRLAAIDKLYGPPPASPTTPPGTAIDPTVAPPTAAPSVEPTPAPSALQEPAPAPPSDTQRAESHARFLKYHDEGVEAFNRQDYAAALASLQTALREEDDAPTLELLQQCLEKTTKPRIAVADFATSGQLEVPEAGKTVADLLLVRFGTQRYQPVERAHLAAILNEQDLSLVGVTANPGMVKGKTLKGVRYLVVGTVARLGTLVVSARMVDVATGEIVNTGEISAPDFQVLQDALADLAALLQMDEREKREFLAERAGQMEYQSRLAAEAGAEELQRRQAQLAENRRAMQAQMAAWRQREASAFAVLNEARAALARGDTERARRLARQGLRDFADTSCAQELTEVYDLAVRELAMAREIQDAERRRAEALRQVRHQRFVSFRDQGQAALQRGDIQIAISFLSRALGEEEDAALRRVLNEQVARRSRPGCAVIVTGSIGGDWTVYADALFGSFGQDRYQYVTPGALTVLLRERSLSVERVLADPRLLRGVKLGDTRYLVVARVDRAARYTVVTEMLDLSTGQVVQTAEMVCERTEDVQVAIRECGSVLVMDAPQRGQWQDRQRQYAQHVDKGEQTVKAKDWSTAAEEYRQAYRIRPTGEAREGLEQAERELARQQDKGARYDQAMRRARQAADRGEWATAQREVELALSIDPNGAEAKALADRIAPVLVVTASSGGREVRGALITLNGLLRSETTPARIRLETGKSYEVVVNYRGTGGQEYRPVRKSMRIDKAGPVELRAELESLPAPAPTPVPRPIPAPTTIPGPTPTPIPRPRPPVTQPPPPPTRPVIPPVTPAPSSAPAPTPRPRPPATRPVPPVTQPVVPAVMPVPTPTSTPRPVLPVTRPVLLPTPPVAPPTVTPRVLPTPEPKPLPKMEPLPKPEPKPKVEPVPPAVDDDKKAQTAFADAVARYRRAVLADSAPAAQATELKAAGAALAEVRQQFPQQPAVSQAAEIMTNLTAARLALLNKDATRADTAIEAATRLVKGMRTWPVDLRPWSRQTADELDELADQLKRLQKASKPEKPEPSEKPVPPVRTALPRVAVTQPVATAPAEATSRPVTPLRGPVRR